ncbi:MAG: hypothetical protein KDI09_13625, partial [Halioglobus sp.]|nr:hypothetical protein [Halioglobus sp.]
MTNTNVSRGLPYHWIFYGFCLLLVWLPIPRGSVQSLPTGIMEIVCFSLLTLWLLFRLTGARSLPDVRSRIRMVLLLLVASLGYQLLQVVPLPPEIVRWLSPNAYEVYSFSWAESARPTYSLSVGVEPTLREFLKSAAYLAVFFLTLALVDCRKRLVQLAYVLIGVGVAQSILGLFDV